MSVLKFNSNTVWNQGVSRETWRLVLMNRVVGYGPNRSEEPRIFRFDFSRFWTEPKNFTRTDNPTKYIKSTQHPIH